MTYAYIGLGSNSGHSQRHLRHAARLLQQLPGARLTAVSSLYCTAPQGCPGRQAFYYNAAVELQTTQAPQRLFKSLRRLEKKIQKKPRAKNTARRLDADYLIHGHAKIRNATLRLPHPLMHKRAFVLLPLSDVIGENSGNRPIKPQQLRLALSACRDQKIDKL